MDFERFDIGETLQPFYEGLRADELRIPFCEKVNRYIWPVRGENCNCGESPAWRTVEDPTGELYTFVVVHHRTSSVPIEVPFVVGLVEVPSAGVRLYGLIRNLEEGAEPDIGESLEFAPHTYSSDDPAWDGLVVPSWNRSG